MTKPELMEYIESAAEIALSECRTENPLEAWARFLDALDSSARRRIGDTLQAQGRNRYTGKAVDA